MKALKLGVLVVLAAVSLTGCGGGTKVSTDSGGKMKITWAGNTRMLVEKDSVVEKFLEEKFNVEIEAIWAGEDKLAAMIASDDVPDVMYMAEPSNWQPLADQGIIATVPIDMIEKYAPNHFAGINSVDKRIWGVSKYKGENYAVPKLMGNDYNAGALWRLDWLEKVGITKVPDTLEEFEEAYTKFRNNDPDGNGKKDTYGLTGQGGHTVRQFDEIFGAYGVMPGQWREVDGKIINSTIMPEAKEALKLLNRWYTAELIDPEMITETPQSSTQKFENGRYGYMHVDLSSYSENMPAGKSNLELWKKRNPDAKFVYGAIPKGAEGKRGDWLWGPRGNFVVFSQALEADRSKMQKILEMCDTMLYDEETALMVTWGEKGVHYDYNDHQLGNEGGLKYLSPYDADKNKAAEAGIGQVGFFSQFAPASGWASRAVLDKYTPKEFNKEVERLVSFNEGRDVLMRAQLPSATLYSSNLDNFKTSAYSEFIIGKRSLDNWDDFVKEWNEKGGAQLTKEAQEFYEENIKE